MPPAHPKKRQKRVMTSAIEGMSVADVRKCLADVRRQWAEHSPDRPFRGCNQVRCVPDSTASMNVEELAFAFITGHHNKRHSK